MALPKHKERKPPRSRDNEKPAFDPYWTGKRVDSEADYIQNACREAKGWFRGARIR